MVMINFQPEAKGVDIEDDTWHDSTWVITQDTTILADVTVYVDDDRDIFSYTTEINGILQINQTRFHRIGTVSGTGTLYTQQGDLPAGFYSDFLSESGGTLEFGSITVGEDYSVTKSIGNRAHLGTFPVVAPTSA